MIPVNADAGSPLGQLASEPTAPGFLLLRRALLNAGDHLIVKRARRLIEVGHPGITIDIADAWRPLREQVPADRLAGYRAIVIGGGPGYAHGLARTYPIGDLGGLPPVVPLALGSYVVPGTEAQLGAYHFAGEDRAFLDRVYERSPFLGARDPVSAELLRRNGYDRVLMTGDPAWYDLERMGEDMIVPPALDRIALTAPANPAYSRQAIRLFEALAADRPETSFQMVHHRGVQVPFARLADRHGWENREISGTADGFALYDEAAMHVGYRVHAHLYAMSRGILSYLVAEDSRGTGMIEGLGGGGTSGFGDAPGSFAIFSMRHLPRYANPTKPGRWRAGPAAGRLLGLPDVAPGVVGMIRADEAAGFPAHQAARLRIRATMKTMQRMVASLP